MKIANDSPARMSPDEIVSEIRELRDEIFRLSTRLHELSRVLYAKARRSTDADTTPSLTLYANAWSRFSGAVGQGLQRIASADHVLKTAQQRTQERKERQAREEAAQDRKEQRAHRETMATPLIPSPGVEDLVALYGQDVVTNA
jgi:hypothetical protein